MVDTTLAAFRDYVNESFLEMSKDEREIIARIAADYMAEVKRLAQARQDVIAEDDFTKCADQARSDYRFVKGIFTSVLDTETYW